MCDTVFFVFFVLVYTIQVHKGAGFDCSQKLIIILSDNSYIQTHQFCSQIQIVDVETNK